MGKVPVLLSSSPCTSSSGRFTLSACAPHMSAGDMAPKFATWSLEVVPSLIAEQRVLFHNRSAVRVCVKDSVITVHRGCMLP